MKFKEFKINATSNQIVRNEVMCHLTKLGYKSSGVSSGFYFAYENGQVCWDESVKYFSEKQLPEITLDDFFKLTKEDVIVKPKKTLAEFNLLCEAYFDVFDGIKTRLTQSQIDRIKVIIGEDND